MYAKICFFFAISHISIVLSTIVPYCKRNEFYCKVGECISTNYKCDGKVDCADGSDELDCDVCPSYLFKCKSGGCINADYECDNKQDCDDNSDEETAKCLQQEKCKLNEYECINKECIPLGNLCDGTNECTDNSDELHHVCKKKKCTLDDTFTCSYGACINMTLRCNGKRDCYDNSDEIGCKSNRTGNTTCPSLSSTNYTSVTCDLKNKHISCDHPPENTRAKFICQTFYEDPILSIHSNNFCVNGSWIYPLARCEAVCGVIVDTNASQYTNYPWHISIYDTRKDFFCSGTLISQKLTLTAAHCKMGNLSSSILAAGNQYQQFNDSRDSFIQYVKVIQVLIHEDYNDGQPFLAFDLAVIVHDAFNLTQNIHPICLPNNELLINNLLQNKTLLIPSWNNETKHLETKTVAYKNETNCNINEDYKVYYLPTAIDKLCGSLIGTQMDLIEGDSGGALIYLHQNRYQLIGLTSLMPENDNESYALFTNIKYHMQYITHIRINNN